MGYFAPYIRRFFASARTYAGTLSTTVVTLGIGWLSQRGITDIDQDWALIASAGLISVVLLNLQKLALRLDDKYANLAALRWLVAITRLGAPPPEYDSAATYRKEGVTAAAVVAPPTDGPPTTDA